MDAAVAAVLDTYHWRMDEERRMRHAASARERREGSRDHLLLAVGPQTGRLLDILARSLRAPRILELGTSFGYSTIWLAEAARASGGHVVTMELAEHKSAHAREMAARAGLSDFVDFQVGDALDLVAALPGPIDFVLLDLWKDLYLPCFEAFRPKLRPGAIVVADNIVRPGGEPARLYVEAVRAMPGMRSLLLPVGSGLEVTRLDG